MVMEPSSVSIEIGVMTCREERLPRTRAIGVLPSFCVHLSPYQLAKGIRVYDVWQQVFAGQATTKKASPSAGTMMMEDIRSVRALRDNKDSAKVATAKNKTPECTAQVVSTKKEDSAKVVTAKNKTESTESTTQVVSTKKEDSVEQRKEEEVKSSLSVSFRISQCKLVLFDLAPEDEETKQQAAFRVGETMIFDSSMFDLFLSVSSNASSEITLNGEGLEIYTAIGEELKKPLQIMDPMKFSGSVLIQNNSHMEVKLAMLSFVNVIISTQHVAFLHGLLTGFSDVLGATSQEEEAPELFHLTQADVSRIEKLENELEEEKDESSSDGLESAEVSRSEATKEASAIIVSIKLTMADTVVTFVNDLQGLDEALFRIAVNDVSAGGELKYAAQAAFEFRIDTSFVADYFDSAQNMWRVLLKKPLEVRTRGWRGEATRFPTNPLSTTFDVDLSPCFVILSEQFLVSLSGASHMWSAYSAAVASIGSSTKSDIICAGHTRRGVAAGVARKVARTHPYAVENRTGIDLSFSPTGGNWRQCPSGTFQYFRYQPSRGSAGHGGKRLYGQDSTEVKSIQLCLASTDIDVGNIEANLGRGKRAHTLANGAIIFMEVFKEGSTTVLHLTSQVGIENLTSLPFAIQMLRDGNWLEAGLCPSHCASEVAQPSHFSRGSHSKPSKGFGVDSNILNGIQGQWASSGKSSVSLLVSPQLESNSPVLHGKVDIDTELQQLSATKGRTIKSRYDVLCQCTTSPDGPPADSFVLQVNTTVSLIDETHPFVSISLEPRALIESKLPLAITVRTPAAYTFSPQQSKHAETIEHEVQPGGRVEVFSSGPSIAVAMNCSEVPVDGSATRWANDEWADLPFAPDNIMQEPLRLLLPFVSSETKQSAPQPATKGIEIIVTQGDKALFDLSGEKLQKADAKKSRPTKEEQSAGMRSLETIDDDFRTFYITICNFALDHTGNILFEQEGHGERGLKQSLRIGSSMRSPHTMPFGAYNSPLYRWRLTLLPNGSIPLCLQRMAMDGDKGSRRSQPFRIDDVSISDGGIETTPIKWEGSSSSGYYAYRTILNSHQSEIHIIPEFVIANCCENQKVVVRQPGQSEFMIEPGKFAPVWAPSNTDGLLLSFDFVDIGGQTSPIRVGALGLHVAVIRSPEGSPLGSLAVQTAIGARDSRLVIKLGDVRRGELMEGGDRLPSNLSVGDDFFRFRLRWSELQLTLNESNKEANLAEVNKPLLQNILDRVTGAKKNESWKDARQEYMQEQEQLAQPSPLMPTPVCTVTIRKVMIDWQRIFKEEGSKHSTSKNNIITFTKRTQLSLVIHNMLITDNTPNSPCPIVFDSTSQQTNFVDLCVRFRGSLDAGLVKVDLVDLNLARTKGKSENICLATSEEFVWKLIDFTNRVGVAAKELAGIDMELVWDEKTKGFVVSIKDAKKTNRQDVDTTYEPPKVERLYNVRKARVSPFTTVTSFVRNPQASRYKKLDDAWGAGLINYITSRLKFTIDKAELRFARYETENVKGPPDHLVELFAAVYLSRMKLKIFTLITAASIQDWKSLISNETDDAERDILRVTGKSAGKKAGGLVGKVDKGRGNVESPDSVEKKKDAKKDTKKFWPWDKK